MKSGMRSVSSRWTCVMLALVLIGLMAPAAQANTNTTGGGGATNAPGMPGSSEAAAGGDSGASMMFLSTSVGFLMCMMAAVPAAFNKLGSY